jgi:hypothetical protein
MDGGEGGDIVESCSFSEKRGVGMMQELLVIRR